MYLTNHNEILNMSQQLHCRDMWKILVWLAEYILSQSTVNFGRIQNFFEIPLVGQVPGALL